MLTGRRKILINLLKLSDIFILACSLLASAWLAGYEMWGSVKMTQILALRIRILNLIYLGLLMGVWQFFFKYFRLYESRRLNTLFNEWKDILKATSFGSLSFYAAGKIFHIDAFSFSFILIFFAASTAFTVSFRTLLRLFLKKVRLYGRNLRNVIIVGTNERAYEFARKIEEDRHLGYRVLGYVDSAVHLPHNGRKLLGKPENFSAILNNYIVDEVVITLPIKSSYETIQQIISACEEQGVIVRHVNDLFKTRIARSRLEEFEEGSVTTISSWPLAGWRQLAKRNLDILLGAFFILITSPVMFLAALAIKLTSPGPVFFVQERIGFNKRRFKVYKFRTMYVNAEKMHDELLDKNEMDGPVFKIKNDPRITSVGRILRKTSLDELPQFFNILRGEMSIVGPRPLSVRDYNNGFSTDWHRRRFSVPPGITCIWQIKGRNDISFEDWMKLDMEYIDNWKLSLDLKIILKTIPVVISGKGAA